MLPVRELLHASRQFAREHGLTLRDLCTDDTECVVRQLDALEADCQSASADILADAASKRLIELGIKDVYTLRGGLLQWAKDGNDVDGTDPDSATD